MKQPAVYMMANKPNGLLDGFTKKYACKSLVFFEIHHTMESAILREKQLKAGSRQKKIKLIEVQIAYADFYIDPR